MQPRMLVTFDTELRPLPVTVRVGQVGTHDKNKNTTTHTNENNHTATTTTKTGTTRTASTTIATRCDGDGGCYGGEDADSDDG